MKHYFSRLPKAEWKGGKCRTMEHKWGCDVAQECVQEQRTQTARGTSFHRRSGLSIALGTFKIPSIGGEIHSRLFVHDNCKKNSVKNFSKNFSLLQNVTLEHLEHL